MYLGTLPFVPPQSYINQSPGPCFPAPDWNTRDILECEQLSWNGRPSPPGSGPDVDHIRSDFFLACPRCR